MKLPDIVIFMGDLQVELYGKQPRISRPLKDMTDEWLLMHHDYFTSTAPEQVVEGMELDKTIIGPPLTPTILQNLIPSHRLVVDELRRRNIIIEGKEVYTSGVCG